MTLKGMSLPACFFVSLPLTMWIHYLIPDASRALYLLGGCLFALAWNLAWPFFAED